MPEKSQMKMQFLEIDGRTVPIVYPQHGDGDDGWDVTGKDNPLPTANYVQNDSGLWVPVSKNNPVPTQLTGSIAELETITSGIEISAGSTITIARIDDAYKYKAYRLSVRFYSPPPSNWSITMKHFRASEDDIGTNSYVYMEHRDYEERYGLLEETTKAETLIAEVTNGSNETANLGRYFLLGVN